MARTKRTASKVRRSERGSPHDGLFHRTFSIPRHAASELQSLLPPALVKRIKWDKLRKASDKFVDAKLTNRYSDVLFEVEIDGEEAFIYVLYEHKSEPEKWTLLQLLEYMVRIWRAYLRERGDKPIDRLPIILPVVLHHGETGWTAPRRFAEYFGKVQKALRPYIPDFGILLDDVGKVRPEMLLSRPLTAEAKLVLLCLLLGRTPRRFFAELRRHPDPLVETWSQADGAVAISGIIVYTADVGHVPEVEITMAMQQILKLSPAERVIFAEKVLEENAIRRGLREGRREGRLEGRLEGRREGRLEGKLEGQQEFFRELLTQRFGDFSPEVSARIQAATPAELKAMTLRVLTAATLNEVLGNPKRKRK